MTTRLLITMRDMAAAAHLAEIIKPARVDARFDVHVYAMDPASAFLKSLGIDHHKIDLPNAIEQESSESAALLQKAHAILDDVKPDVVLTGLSTPLDGGIDEAILATSQAPTFLLQDFWGEQNAFFGKGAQTAFVLDEVAAVRNEQRFGMKSIITGSARHAAYKNTDWAKIRADLRKKLSISENTRIIGFFGQALNYIPGYWRTVAAFIDATAELGPDIVVSVRPHPREKQSDRDETLRRFESIGVRTIKADEGPIENTLPMFDVVCSLFSNCTFDASYQNWFSNEPLSVPVSMLFDPEIADYYRQRVEFEKLPIHTQGLVIPVYKQNDLVKTLRDALTPEARTKAWQKAKKSLPDPTRAPDIILDTLAEASGK